MEPLRKITFTMFDIKIGFVELTYKFKPNLGVVTNFNLNL